MKASPEEQLRAELAVQKSLGTPFEPAWDLAFGKLRWPDDKHRRKEWINALTETRQVWRDCYLDTGQPIEMDILVTAIGE